MKIFLKVLLHLSFIFLSEEVYKVHKYPFIITPKNQESNPIKKSFDMKYITTMKLKYKIDMLWEDIKSSLSFSKFIPYKCHENTITPKFGTTIKRKKEISGYLFQNIYSITDYVLKRIFEHYFDLFYIDKKSKQCQDLINNYNASIEFGINLTESDNEENNQFYNLSLIEQLHKANPHKFHAIAIKYDKLQGTTGTIILSNDLIMPYRNRIPTTYFKYIRKSKDGRIFIKNEIKGIVYDYELPNLTEEDKNYYKNLKMEINFYNKFTIFPKKYKDIFKNKFNEVTKGRFNAECHDETFEKYTTYVCESSVESLKYPNISLFFDHYDLVYKRLYYFYPEYMFLDSKPYNGKEGKKIFGILFGGEDNVISLGINQLERYEVVFNTLEDDVKFYPDNYKFNKGSVFFIFDNLKNLSYGYYICIALALVFILIFIKIKTSFDKKNNKKINKLIDISNNEEGDYKECYKGKELDVLN